MSVKKRPNGIYFLIAAISLLIAVFLLFFTAFFETHFYPGTVINEVKVSCLTPEEADRRLENWASAYILVLNERDNVGELIRGSEIGLKCDPLYGSAVYKYRQNQTLWIISSLKRSNLTFGGAFTYEEDLLKKRYGKLDCLDKSKVIEPKNAGLSYSNGGYQTVKEVYGNQVNEKKLYTRIVKAVKNGKPAINLEKLNCYFNPSIKSDSPKVENAKRVAEGYIASKIIYPHTGGTEIVDADKISSWIEFDEDLNIAFNEKKVLGFLYKLAEHYDTYGKVRDFATSSGGKIKIGGGDYGWKVDIKKEKSILIAAIVNGQTITREPEYSQKGVLHDINDIGRTYVEIDLTKQHLWYYNDGALVAHGDVVTGNMNRGYKTPEGIYSLKYKVRNAVLKGVNYRASVSYWMPFNNDIGIHDAPWRTQFGRDIYLTRGSHGCINVAFSLAETLFNNIDVGTPIVCYY